MEQDYEKWGNMSKDPGFGGPFGSLCNILFPKKYNKKYTIKHVPCVLTHWYRVTRICQYNITNTASDNGLPPVCRQDIIWTDAAILSIRP